MLLLFVVQRRDEVAACHLQFYLRFQPNELREYTTSQAYSNTDNFIEILAKHCNSMAKFGLCHNLSSVIACSRL